MTNYIYKTDETTTDDNLWRSRIANELVELNENISKLIKLNKKKKK